MTRRKTKKNSLPLQPEAKPPERADTESPCNEVARLNMKFYDDIAKLTFAGVALTQFNGNFNIFLVGVGCLLSFVFHCMAIQETKKTKETHHD